MITKAALLLFRDNANKKELLFCKPKGKPYLIFPGGKQEQGELIDDTLQRELQEELGVQASNVEKLGVVSGQTPDGRDLEMHLYSAKLLGEPHPQAEIEEIAWMGKDAIADKVHLMTPMTLNYVVPFLASRNIW